MNNRPLKLCRREMPRRSAQAAALAALGLNCALLLAAPEKRRFKIGACDWSVEKRCDPVAFEVARQTGLAGIQVSLGTLANDMHLRTRVDSRENLTEGGGGFRMVDA